MAQQRAKTAPPAAIPKIYPIADFNRIAGLVDHDCILGPGAKDASPENKLASCDAAVADLERLDAKAKSPSEHASLSFLIASYDFRRAGVYLAFDKVRSQRVCSTAERSYARIAKIDQALLDAELTNGFVNSRQAMSNSAAACRRDFGTPTGAPPVIPK